MSRLLRAVDRDSDYETVMKLAGERGLLTLHLWKAEPECLVIHAPVSRDGWTGPCQCLHLEMACWCLNSAIGPELDEELVLCRLAQGEEELWNVLAQSYHLYLEH